MKNLNNLKMSFNKFFKLKKINLSDVLFLFIPFSIIAGNLIINLISILTIFVGINFFYKKIISFIKENKNLLIILFIFFFLNIEFSSNQLVSLISTIGLIRYLLLGLILYFWFLKDEDNCNFFLISILIALLLTASSIYAELVYKEYFNIISDRMSGIFFDEYVAGGYISKLFFLVLIFIHLNKAKNYRNKLLSFFILLFLYFNVLLSGDRAPIFMLTFSLIIFFTFYKSFKPKKKVGLSIITIFCFLLIYYFSPNLKEKIQYSFDQLGIEPIAKVLFNLNYKINKLRYQKELSSFEEYKNLTDKTIKRNFLKTKWGAHYITAFEIGKTNYILGSGIKTFRYECLNDKYISDIVNHSASYRCATHPHNLYFEVFSEAGLLGLLIFFYLHYLIFRKVIKIKNGDIKITAISIFIVLFFPIQTTGSYFSTFNGIFYFMNLPVIIYLANKFGLNSKIIHT